MTDPTATDQDRKCSTMTTPTTPTTPIALRRQTSINDAVTAALHLLSVLRGYRAARRDGFPMSHLARIESVLEEAKNTVFDMVASERTDLVEFGVAAEEEERLRLAAAWPRRAPGFRSEPTLPASAVLRTVTEGDDD